MRINTPVLLVLESMRPRRDPRAALFDKALSASKNNWMDHEAILIDEIMLHEGVSKLAFR